MELKLILSLKLMPQVARCYCSPIPKCPNRGMFQRQTKRPYFANTLPPSFLPNRSFFTPSYVSYLTLELPIYCHFHYLHKLTNYTAHIMTLHMQWAKWSNSVFLFMAKLNSNSNTSRLVPISFFWKCQTVFDVLMFCAKMEKKKEWIMLIHWIMLKTILKYFAPKQIWLELILIEWQSLSKDNLTHKLGFFFFSCSKMF